MKRKLSKIFVIAFLIIIAIGNKKTLATKSTGIDEIIAIVPVEMSTNPEENTLETISPDILEKLRKWGYEGNEVTAQIKIKTTLYIDSTSGGYRIRIGEDRDFTADTQINVSEDVLKNVYGYPYDEIVEGNGWDAVIIVESVTTNNYVTTTYIWEGILEEVYTGDIDTFWANVKRNWKRDKIGFFMYYLLEILRFAFADVEQTLINFIQTSTDHARDWVYTYSKEKLMNEGTEGKRNKYTRVTNYEKGQGESWQKIIDITKEEDDLRFEESSKIPVMTGDWYNAAVGHIDIFDVNFLTGNKNHDEGSIWMIIRNFAVACINITIYAASAIILITLFIYGIQILVGSFKNPEEEAEFKSKLNRFATSVATLIGCVLIMALCIFGSNALFNSYESTNTEELPIRVNVEGAGYSFSTTPTGYIGYMAKSNDVKRCVEKFAYTIAYIVMVWGNVAIIAIMLVRTATMWILAVIGPITAVLCIFDIQTRFDFRRWIRLFVLLSSMQVILSFINMIILKYLF